MRSMWADISGWRLRVCDVLCTSSIGPECMIFGLSKLAADSAGLDVGPAQ